MDFDTPEEHAFLRDSIRQYFSRELSENKIREMDRARRIPRDIWKTIGELGWLGLSGLAWLNWLGLVGLAWLAYRPKYTKSLHPNISECGAL